MHPFLHRRSYLGAYLAVWLPLAWLVISLVKVSTAIHPIEAAVLLVPMILLYATAGLTTWYVCRATPLRSSGMLRVFTTHLFEAFLLTYLWVQIGRWYARFLSTSPSFAGLNVRYDTHAATLMVAGVFLYLVNVGFFYVLIAIEASRAAEARALETSILARDAELRALKAQVNPHFLFNSLNSISALTSIDPARAKEMCILLGDFLRMTLGLGEKAAVPLREELELLKRFLAIEKVRFGARLQVDEQIDPQAESCLVPPLILQPLVENAIVHGIANLTQGGTVRLKVLCNEGWLQISIENSFDPEAARSRKGGLGLSNVRQRVEARYPKQGSVRAEAEEDSFRVYISIPAELPTAQQPDTSESPESQKPALKEVRS